MFRALAPRPSCPRAAPQDLPLTPTTRRLVLPATAVLAMSALPAPRRASAHALVTEAEPAAGAVLEDGPPPRVRLRFNSRIDRARSALRLLRPDHSEAGLPIAEDGAPPDTLHTSTDLPAGRYVVRWQVLATDGHITRGDVPFTVGP